MKKEIYEIRDWYLSKMYQYVLAHGKCYGNPKFYDGERMHTSIIVKAEVQDDFILFTTRNSMYRCWFSDHQNRFEDLRLLSEFMTQKDAEIIGDKIKKAVRAKRQGITEKLLKLLPASEKAYILLCLSSEGTWWEDICLIKREGEEPLLQDFTIHIGTFDDSVLVLNQDINIGYFPFPTEAGAEFYRIHVPAGMKVYVYNSGKEKVAVSGYRTAEEGFYLMPGEMKGIFED